MVEGTIIRMVGHLPNLNWTMEGICCLIANALDSSVELRVNIIDKQYLESYRKHYATQYPKKALGHACKWRGKDEGEIQTYNFSFFLDGKKHYIEINKQGFFEISTVYHSNWKLFLRKLTSMKEEFQNKILSERMQWANIVNKMGCSKVLICSDMGYLNIEDMIESPNAEYLIVTDFLTLLFKVIEIDDSNLILFKELLAKKLYSM